MHSANRAHEPCPELRSFLCTPAHTELCCGTGLATLAGPQPYYALLIYSEKHSKIPGSTAIPAVAIGACIGLDTSATGGKPPFVATKKHKLRLLQVAVRLGFFCTLRGLGSNKAKKRKQARAAIEHANALCSGHTHCEARTYAPTESSDTLLGLNMHAQSLPQQPVWHNSLWACKLQAGAALKSLTTAAKRTRAEKEKVILRA